MSDLPKTFSFDGFQFDADRLALYFEGDLIKACDKKSLQVLAVLLLNPNRLTTHEEVIEKVWQDNPLGVTSGHIGQYISRLRKMFAEFAPDKQYIETKKGLGYCFKSDVLTNETAFETIRAEPISAGNFAEIPSDNIETKRSFHFRASVFVISAFVLILLTAFAAWTRFADDDEDKIRHAVQESQLYESLVLYKNTAAFAEENLDKYWIAEPNAIPNADRVRIRESVKKLTDEGRRYGDETKCEQFEFQSIEINKGGNFATVRTLEKWFIAVYFKDGTLEKNKTVGPYFVNYLLRKIDNRWLIEKSSTARMNRPVPRLSDVQSATEIKSGEQFFVMISGQDFEVETIALEISGGDCAAGKPCKLPNILLREKAKITETTLENIPLTLKSGEYQITVRNGDSKISNPVSLKVP